MLGIVKLLVAAVLSLFMSRRRLEAEVLVLRHQLNVLRRSAPRRVRLFNTDRVLLVWLFRLAPSVLRSVMVVRPETLIRWHRRGFRAYWRWKSRAGTGRPLVAKETRDLIREISLANPLWGAPRVHGELLKLGIAVAESTVAKYIAKGRGGRPPGQSWKTFLHNQAAGIASIDLFVAPTITFKLLYGFIVLGHDRRRLLSFGVTTHPTAAWLARQISEAFPWKEALRHLVRDRDGSYGDAFTRRVRAMGIRDHPIAAGRPWQNGYVERLIGSIRRECLDHVIIVNADHLRRVMAEYARYYNRTRTHLSLHKDTPCGRPVHSVGRITSMPYLGGLHHSFVRI
jgi:transposase InsO family protein